MNAQRASAVVEVRAVVKEPEQRDAVADMWRCFIHTSGRIVETDYVVRCTPTSIDAQGYRLRCAVCVEAIGPMPELDLQFMLDRVVNHFKKLAHTTNVGFSVSHSTYDLFMTKEISSDKTRKEKPGKTPAASYARKHTTCY